MATKTIDQAGARTLFEYTISGFLAHTEVDDPFGLLRLDTAEMPRYVLTIQALQEHAAGRASPVVCDVGGYYGLMAAAAGQLGYAAHVVDRYGWAEHQHEDVRSWWDSQGVTAHDIDLEAQDVRLPFEDGSVDVVLFGAVIEHFAHTPRFVLAEMRRVLRDDGLLVVETPNAGWFGARIGFLLHGEGLWAPIENIYRSDIPFAGHSRCYSRRELSDVLGWSGFDPVQTVMLELGTDGQGTHSGGIRGRLLYDVVYPRLAKRFPDLRACIWMSAAPRVNVQ